MAYFFNGTLSLFNPRKILRTFIQPNFNNANGQHLINLENENQTGNQNVNHVFNHSTSSRYHKENSNETPRENAYDSMLSTTISEANVFVLFEYPETPNFIPIKREIKIDNSSKGFCVELPQHIELKCAKVSPCGEKLEGFHENKWELIKKCLKDYNKDLNDLEKVIKSYNPDLKDSHFDVLHKLSTEDIKLIPEIVGLALRLTDIVPEAIPLLPQKANKILFISQHQISCLLANAFLCTFPEHKPSFPYINFNNLFVSNGRFNESKVKLEKLKCILNYFRRVISDPPKGSVSFQRKFLDTNEIPKWRDSYKKLSKLHVLDKGSIESDGLNMLQVDFANKVVGGGVLNRGSVQEEIRFCINTELIISRLFTQELLDEEVLIIRGSENFNAYSGYGNQFEWERDRKDSTPIDDYGRRSTTIVAMDALSFTAHNKYTQYEKKYINRELNKAYCGFSENVPSNKTPIATGNWGCGAFNGDKSLKALIQLMVASECERDLVYFTFGDSSLKRDLENFYSFISERNFTVGQLYKALEYYDKEVTYSYKKIDLFDFIRNSKNKIY